MRPLIFFYHSLQERYKNLNQLKAITLKYQLYQYSSSEKSHQVIQKLKLIFAILLFPFYFLIKAKKTNKKIAVFDLHHSPSHEQNRAAYLNHYTKIKDSDIVFVSPNHYRYSSFNWTKFKQLLKIWFIHIKTCYFIIRDLNKPVGYHYLFNTLVFLINEVLIDSTKNIYFCAFSLDIYLTKLIGSNLKSLDRVFTSSEAFLYFCHRYIELPDCKIALCGKYNLPEYQKLKEFKWINTKSKTLWGPEDFKTHSQLKPFPSEYDIGIYSSGEWARKDGWYRTKEIESIRNGATSKNDLHQLFMEMLNAIIFLKEKEQLKIKMYLHPYERNLAKQYKIYPPFLGLLDKHEIVYDLEGSSSTPLIYESKLGVSLVSTIIRERWHLGLEGFLYAGIEEIDYTIRPKYLGPFQKSFFFNMEELKTKITNTFEQA